MLSFSATLRVSDNKINLFKTQFIREERQQRSDSEYKLAESQSSTEKDSVDDDFDTMRYNLQAY